MIAKIGRLTKGCQHLVGDALDIGQVRHLRQQNQKFITAMSAHRIRSAHRGLHAVGSAFQNLVTDRVTVVVIDRLKAIEVHVQKGEATLMTLGICNGLRQTVQQQGAIG